MIRSFLRLLLYVLAFSAPDGAAANAVSASDGSSVGNAFCPVVRIVPERLPDLNIPRSGHNIFYIGGELTVAGGHTTHFVPTPTAEYFANGQWHLLEMAYSHDNAFAVAVGPDEVVIGGGHEEPLGIGQTFLLERYLPKTHTFEGFGCLDRRRVLANATRLGDGRVIIVGNHYADDVLACYDGHSQVQHVKRVAQGRSNPYILPVAYDDALILGANDVYDQRSDTVWVDRVKGDAFRVPLLEQWRLVYTDQPFSSLACAIGNVLPPSPADSTSLAGEQQGDYAYLLSATDENGQLAIVVVRHKGDGSDGEPSESCFSLLPTVCPIPTEGPFGPIFYKGPIVADRKGQRGYMIGVDSLYHRQYVLAIDYVQQPAPLTLYYTDSMECAAFTIPVVTPDGDLILAGGIPDNNYKPFATVWLYHFATPLTSQPSPFSSRWPWVVLGIAAIAVLTYIIYRRRKRPVGDNPTTDDAVDSQTVSNDSDPLPLSDNKHAELMERICQLMDEEQLFLHSDLRLQDVAVRLSTNSNYISECINSVRSMSFSQFVNTYRVRHAQALLRQQPDIKIATLATESGFSTEASFFRNFKAVTGTTPRDWLGQKNEE